MKKRSIVIIVIIINGSSRLGNKFILYYNHFLLNLSIMALDHYYCKVKKMQNMKLNYLVWPVFNRAKFVLHVFVFNTNFYEISFQNPSLQINAWRIMTKFLTRTKKQNKAIKQQFLNQRYQVICASNFVTQLLSYLTWTKSYMCKFLKNNIVCTSW